MSKIVAIHYRMNDEEKAGLQGCWKEFFNSGDANKWLDLRTKKTFDSPKGRFTCSTDRDGIAYLEAILIDTWNPYKYSDSLKAAIANYLKWKRANHGSNPSLF